MQFVVTAIVLNSYRILLNFVVLTDQPTRVKLKKGSNRHTTSTHVPPAYGVPLTWVQGFKYGGPGDVRDGSVGAWYNFSIMNTQWRCLLKRFLYF